MFSDNRKLYLVTVATLAALLPVLFVSSNYIRIAAAVVLAVAAGATMTLIKKRGVPSINHRRVAGLLAVIAVVYTVILFVLGIWFGFHYNPTPLSAKRFLRYVLPVAVIIVSTEIIRYILLSYSKRVIVLLAYVICIVTDLLIGGGIAAVTRGIAHFMDVVGLALFPAITSNLFYHYLAKRHGPLPGIVFRLLLALPLSFLPIAPSVSDALQSFLLVLLPLAVWLFVDMLYEKKARVASRRVGTGSYVAMGVTVLCMAAVVALVSGQFRYRLLVIATPSMTGELNVGDAIVYERYDGEVIQNGTVVVFGKDEDTTIVHRVVDVQQIDGQIRYTTKGDANEGDDAGYITAESIRGIVLFKVSHIGHPTLWLRELLS